MNANKHSLNIQNSKKSPTQRAQWLKKDSNPAGWLSSKIIFRSGLFLAAAVLSSSEAYAQYNMGWGGMNNFQKQQLHYTIQKQMQPPPRVIIHQPIIHQPNIQQQLIQQQQHQLAVKAQRDHADRMSREAEGRNRPQAAEEARVHAENERIAQELLNAKLAEEARVRAEEARIAQELLDAKLAEEARVRAENERIERERIEEQNLRSDPMAWARKYLKTKIQEGQPKNPTINVPSSGRSAFTLIGDPVDLESGAFLVDTVDLTVGSVSEISFRRHYSSQHTVAGDLGFGWSHNYARKLILGEKGDDSLIYVHEADGSVVVYAKEPEGTVWIPDFSHTPHMELNEESFSRKWGYARIENQRLDGNQSGYTHYAADGSRNFYRGEKGSQELYLSYQEGVDGHTIHFNYEEAKTADEDRNRYYKRLTKISNLQGQYIEISYNEHGLIEQIGTNTNQYVGYEYNRFGDLIAVIYPNGEVIDYSYELNAERSTHYLTQEKRSEGYVLENIYDDRGRVLEQKIAYGDSPQAQRHLTFEYIADGHSQGAKTTTRVRDPNNQCTEYRFYKSKLYKIIDPLGQVIEKTWYTDTNTLFDPID
ncbi:MAG TPA: DUF6531 domain-containing protein, partial [Opitutales bacterium]|nr:DUF6531 domain-containing protein [Opitutales bacterium]